MAAKPDHDLTQASGSRQLTVEKCQELPFRGQLSHPRIRIVLLHKCFKPVPRHELQNVAEYCIVMRHGDDFPSCPGTLADVQDRIESTPCASSTKIEPDSRGFFPGIPPFFKKKKRHTGGGRGV